MFRWKFNYIIALVGVLLIVALWAAHGARVIILPETIIGATIAVFTLIFNFFFRKSPPEDKP